MTSSPPPRGHPAQTLHAATAACRPCVVVTRAREDCEPMLRAIDTMGAFGIAMPCIAHRPLPIDAGMLHVARCASHYQAVAFASRHGVQSYASLLRQADASLPHAARLFAVGAATAHAVHAHFQRTPVQGAHSDAHHLLAAMLRHLPPAPTKVLLPAARAGRRVLEDGLRAAGHEPTVLRLYETVLPTREEGRPLLWPGVPRFILFGSPSAVRGFLQMTAFPADAQAISIGPATSQALAEANIAIAAEASPHDASGLLNCLRVCLNKPVL